MKYDLGKLFTGILQVAICGLLAWIAHTTQLNAVQLASISEKVIDSDRRDTVQETQLTELRARVTACEIGLAQLNAHK